MLKVLLTALVLFSSASAGTIFYEYFTDSTFPPAGWTTIYTGSGGSYTWSDSGQPGNGYAHGLVNIASSGTGSAMLVSKPFSLTAGNSCNICFAYRAVVLSGSPTRSWDFVLRNGSSIVETITIYETTDYPVWVETCMAFMDIATTSSNYTLGWRVNSSGAGQVVFDLDAVHVAEMITTVESKSLGEIKSTFR